MISNSTGGKTLVHALACCLESLSLPRSLVVSDKGGGSSSSSSSNKIVPQERKLERWFKANEYFTADGSFARFKLSEAIKNMVKAYENGATGVHGERAEDLKEEKAVLSRALAKAKAEGASAAEGEGDNNNSSSSSSSSSSSQNKSKKGKSKRKSK